jgi:N-methylhydantoinase A/oxoprolinase/acetone carboxylase beta subunit
MSCKRVVRIGIDVGGTFTHAVAIEAQSLSLLGKTKVPTTHTAKEGVALGVVEALKELLQGAAIAPEEVAFVAHSTTQATNALLEGDVASVGVIGMGAGANAWLAAMATNPGKLELAPGKLLTSYHRFIDTTTPPTREMFTRVLQELLQDGARAFAISEAFAVDKPDNEQLGRSVAEEMGLLVTTGSEISQLYGLKIRTRTAVLNAAMLPKMLESADLTERCVIEAGIKAPLMIMRSDGGVMDIEAMRKRPLLTMLSGPAAGVAAAMIFLRISDGIFIEVGGTSSDISAIASGRAQYCSAEIGGHKIYLRTLDVRTIGVAGGSMSRLSNGRLVDVGPRSAHIAGLKYVAFSDEIPDPTVKLIAPMAGDAADYLAIGSAAEKPQYCLTPTCAANLLGLVPAKDCASGNLQLIDKCFTALAQLIGKTKEECAKSMLTLAANKCIPTIKALIKDRHLDEVTTVLYAGGGGAAALVPFLAKQLNSRFQLAEEADVISAVGVALALIRESVERQFVNPTNDDILRLRQEAQSKVIAMGANPNSVDTFVEVDSKTNIVRATASGAAVLTETREAKSELSLTDKTKLVAESMRLKPEEVKLIADNENFQLFSANKTTRHFWGIVKETQSPIRVLDRSGTICLQSRNAEVARVTAGEADKIISNLSEKLAHWGDAGKTIPNIIVLAGAKIVDLSGLADIEQIKSLAKVELDVLPVDAKVIVIASQI